MNRHGQWLLIWVLFFSWQSLIGQHFPVVHYDTEHGLPDAHVYHFLESGNGDLLLATERGAFAFDGLNFRSVFQFPHKASTGTIIRMFEDDHGHLWLGSHKQGVFKVTNDSLISTGLNISTSRGLAVLDGILFVDGNQITRTNLQTKVSEELTTKEHNEQLIVGGDGNLYLLKNQSISALDAQGNQKLLVGADDHMKFVSCTPTTGGLLIGCPGKILFWNGDKLTTVLDLPAGFEPGNMIIDRLGRYWFSEKHRGLFVSEGGRIKNLGPLLDLNSTMVTNILEDSRVNVWVATLDMGVFRFHHTYLTNYDKSGGYEGGSVYRILPLSAGKALLATNNDVYLLEEGELMGAGFDCCWFFRDIAEKSPQQFILAAHSKEGPLPEKLSAFGFSFEPDLAYAVASDQNNYYSSYYSRQTFQFKNERKTLLKGSQTDDTHRTQRLLLHNAKVWQATTEGLRVLDTVGNVISDLKSRTGEKNRAFYEDVKDLVLKENAEVWALLDDTIACINAFNLDLLQRSVLKVFPEAMNTMTLDGEQRLWIGTNSGLYCYAQGEAVLHLKRSNGLTSNNVTQVAYDEEGKRILIGTSAGLSVLDIKAWQQHTETTPVLEFDQLLLDSVVLSGNAQIEGLSVNDRASVTVSIHAQHLGETGQLLFRYILDDKEVRTTSESELTLSSLNTGDHLLQVQAKTLNSPWSASLNLEFAVFRPWYRSGYFFLSIAFVLTAFLLALRLRSQRKKHEQSLKELEVKKEINDLQQRSLRALMRPHFSSNIIAAVRQSLRDDDPLAADTAMAQLAQLMRTNLEMVRAETVSLSEELLWLQTYIALEQFARRVTWKVEINIAPSLQLESLVIPPMLIQPFIENAIVHAMGVETPWLSIGLTSKGDQLAVAITDNGPGFDKNSSLQQAGGHVSQGIGIIKERLELLTELTGLSHHLSIQNGRSSSPQFGTRIIITLPKLGA